MAKQRTPNRRRQTAAVFSEFQYRQLEKLWRLPSPHHDFRARLDSCVRAAKRLIGYSPKQEAAMYREAVGASLSKLEEVRTLATKLADLLRAEWADEWLQVALGGDTFRPTLRTSLFAPDSREPILLGERQMRMEHAHRQALALLDQLSARAKKSASWFSAPRGAPKQLHQQALVTSLGRLYKDLTGKTPGRGFEHHHDSKMTGAFARSLQSICDWLGPPFAKDPAALDGDIYRYLKSKCRPV